jgi:hypothetical protein
MDREAVERHAAAQQRQIEVGELDPPDQRLVRAGDEHRAQQVGQDRAHTDEHYRHDEDDPAAGRREQARDAVARGFVDRGFGHRFGEYPGSTAARRVGRRAARSDRDRLVSAGECRPASGRSGELRWRSGRW